MTEAEAELLWEELEDAACSLWGILMFEVARSFTGTTREIEQMARRLRVYEWKRSADCSDVRTDLMWSDLEDASAGLEWHKGAGRRQRAADIEHAAKELRRRYRA